MAVERSAFWTIIAFIVVFFGVGLPPAFEGAAVMVGAVWLVVRRPCGLEAITTSDPDRSLWRRD